MPSVRRHCQRCGLTAGAAISPDICNPQAEPHLFPAPLVSEETAMVLLYGLASILYLVLFILLVDTLPQCPVP